MKKIYFFVAAAVLSTGAMAQGVDTLITHFGGTPTLYSANGGGYVGGNNSYGDVRKMQLFDQNYGVTGPGTVTKVLLNIPVKEQAGAGAGTFQVKIWADNAGQPGTEAGSVTLTMASIDTSLAGYNIIDGSTFYNVTATFSSAVTIPAGQKFWAGVVLPTGAGDTLAMATTTDGDFADADTHVGEWWSDNSFHSFAETGNWELAIALAIFPVVNITALSGIEENEVVASVYPNPTNGALNFVFTSNETSHVLVRDLAGKTVARVDVNGATTVTADFTELSAGSYVYETVSFDGVVTSKSKFVKQ
jgi:hypothetical protein